MDDLKKKEREKSGVVERERERERERETARMYIFIWRERGRKGTQDLLRYRVPSFPVSIEEGAGGDSGGVCSILIICD